MDEIKSFSLDHLRVYKPLQKKIRLGKINDGGYIICELAGNYEIFLSGGIANDISFEQKMLDKYPELKCHAFDGTINELPNSQPLSPNITFQKKNLGKSNTDTTANLREYFDKYCDIFMKMDIEGGEYELFESFRDEDLLKIKQLVIEFHGASHGAELQKRLAKTHWLVHFHPNNYSPHYGNDVGFTVVDGIKIPHVYECTYIRKNPGDLLSLNSNPIPDLEIDMPNNPHEKDIILSGYPFVFSDKTGKTFGSA